MPLLAMRNRFSNTLFNGSFAASADFTSRCLPLVTSVTSITAWRPERSAFNACKTSSFTSNHLFDIDADGPPAGQTYFPGRFVGHAEFEHLRLPAVDHIHGLGDHRTLDATA